MSDENIWYIFHFLVNLPTLSLHKKYLRSQKFQRSIKANKRIVQAMVWAIRWWSWHYKSILVGWLIEYQFWKETSFWNLISLTKRTWEFKVVFLDLSYVIRCSYDLNKIILFLRPLFQSFATFWKSVMTSNI